MSNQAHARLRILKSLDLQSDLTVILDASGSPGSRLEARYVGNASPSGLTIETGTALGPGTIVSVAGEVQTGAGLQPLLGQYRVSSSHPLAAGRYRVNLEPKHEARSEEAPPATERSLEADIDYYEVLQVSRRADTEAIHRVFHVLAQRYHPDNAATGDQEMFRQVVEAHAVLTNPERRAAYDVKLADEDKGRLRIFDSLESTQGVQAEIRKRQGILRLLYTRRLTDPHRPAMRARELAEMLGCPAEHLDFSFWFLRELRHIQRADNNQYEITWQGVEAFEMIEANYVKKQPVPLPAPAQAV
jgi:hypothetical protein